MSSEPKSPISCLYLSCVSVTLRDPCHRLPRTRSPFSELVRDKILRDHNRYKHENYESPVQTAMKEEWLQGLLRVNSAEVHKNFHQLSIIYIKCCGYRSRHTVLGRGISLFWHSAQANFQVSRLPRFRNPGNWQNHAKTDRNKESKMQSY